MKFTNILKSIILENSRFKVLYDSLVQQPSPEGKFKPDPKKIPFETLKALIFADPTTISCDEIFLPNMHQIITALRYRGMLSLINTYQKFRHLIS